METCYLDMEAAFLDWLNQLKIAREQISSLTELKDGTILLKLLNTVYHFKFTHSDPLCFPLGDYDSRPSDHWTISAANLQRIDTMMEEYLETVLKLTVEKGYVNVQSIARDNDRVNLLRLVLYRAHTSVSGRWG